MIINILRLRKGKKRIYRKGKKMDGIFLFILGFGIGLVVVAVAIEIGSKKTSRSTPMTNFTRDWHISEVDNPRVIAEYLVDVDIPEKAKVLVKEYKNEEKLRGHEVRQHKNVKGNFVIGDDRALIIAGPMMKGEIGFWTVEKEIIDKLSNEFVKNWAKAKTVKIKEK